LTVTGSTSLTSYSAKGIYYTTTDGTHRLKFNIDATSSSSITTQTLSISGVTFKSGIYQAVGFATGGTGLCNRRH